MNDNPDCKDRPIHSPRGLGDCAAWIRKYAGPPGVEAEVTRERLQHYGCDSCRRFHKEAAGG